MGWLSYHREPGQTDLDHFFGEFNPDRITVHAHGTVDNVFYAAVEHPREPGVIYAIVNLMHRSRGEHNFAVKLMDETVYPYYTKAPQTVLNALTPTTYEYAQQWRAACHAHHARRAFLRTHLRPGDSVHFERPIPLTTGVSIARLTYTTHNRRVRLRDGSGKVYRIRHWRDRVMAIHKASGPIFALP